VVKDLNGKILDAQVRLQSLEVKKIALEDNRIVNEERFKEIPKRNVEYARLQRTKMTLEKVYVTVEEKYQAALVAEQSQFGYVEILQHAIPPATWVSPNIPKNLGFGFLVGLIIGISLTFLINNFDDRIHKPEDVKKLGVSVLTVVPVMDEQGRNIRGRLYRPTSAVTGERGTIRRELISEEGEDLVAEDSINPRLIAAINPYSRVADAYRRLRTSVQYWKQDVQVKSILVCSGAPQEGKSLTSANLAIVMAQSNKRVLLVDVDLRRPTIHELFNLKLEPGLTEVLFGETDLHSAIRPTFVDNLDTLNPAELINSPAMKNIKDELEKEYDVIIYDSAPILLFTDAELLVSMVDAVVFVVKAESTQMNNLEHAIDIIEGIRMNLVGVVVNHYVLNRLHRGYYHLHGDYYYQQKYSPDGNKS
jgi:capsular exopolysaccharide synthesis family protein